MARPVMVAYLQVAIGALVCGYLLLALYGCSLSDRLIFLPPPVTYPDGPEVLRIPSSDGVTLAARYLVCSDARLTLVYCHGNAEDLGGIEPRLRLLRDRLHVSVLGWDYPGYGRSGGAVDERETLRGAHAVLAYVTGPLGVPEERVVFYGRSLGSGPAVELASSGPCAGLILESAFTSAFRVMTGVRLLPFDKFTNLEKMPRVKCPVLVIHGTADPTIPFSHGRKLFAAAPEPKRCLWVKGAGHNDVMETAGEAYWKTVGEFLAR
jgi:abhydrolase domain-containing protein 17